MRRGRYASVMHSDRYDVIVVGGGPAGGVAAVGAARTLLAETYGRHWSAATMKIVLSSCGLYTGGEVPREVVFDVAEAVLRELAWSALQPIR